jgi:hypothetical protein
LICVSNISSEFHLTSIEISDGIPVLRREDNGNNFTLMADEEDVTMPVPMSQPDTALMATPSGRDRHPVSGPDLS